jgi:phytoene desaturase
MKTKVAIIGAGFSGLAAASYLSNQGLQITVFEKNSIPGGRAGIIESNGFKFDKGPSWYWLPDIYEFFFKQFNKNIKDYYQLTRLNPSYRVHFGINDYLDIPTDIEELKRLFESIETGAAKKLELFLQNAQRKYELVIKKLIYKPALSIWEYIDPWILSSLIKYGSGKSVNNSIRSFFNNPRLIQILEFPFIFLGVSAGKLPAVYSFLNYADFVLGTWYPTGGFYTVTEGFYKLALEFGVKFYFNSSVSRIEVIDNQAKAIWVNKERIEFDIILGTADYHHIENDLLEKKFQSYTDKYWAKRKLTPSVLIYFIGVNRKLKGIIHHNLLLDKTITNNVNQLFNKPKWPDEPFIYISCSSKTDDNSAPVGCENLVVTIPVSSELQDNQEIRQKYFNLFLQRFRLLTGEDISNDIIYMKSYAKNDLVEDYNSFKGNAFGLTNTACQTAFLRPSIKSKKINNLFYAGQSTIPGSGVPACIVSGQVAATEILKRI